MALPKSLQYDLATIDVPDHAREKALAWAATYKTVRKDAESDIYGKGLLLRGPDPVKNRVLACAIGHYCRVNYHAPVTYIAVSEWVRQNKISWDRDGQEAADRVEANDILRRVERSDVLVLDGLGVEKKSEFSAHDIPALLYSRYLRGRPTIATTQLTLDALAAQYTDSTVLDYAFTRVGVVDTTSIKG